MFIKRFKEFYFNNKPLFKDKQYFVLYADIEARLGFELVIAKSKRQAIKQLKEIAYAKSALILIIKVFKRK